MAKKQVRRLLFKYGMRLRPFSVGCQPLDGLIEAQEDPSHEYHNILVYNRRLTDDEVEDYELEPLMKHTGKRITIMREQMGMKQQDLADALGISVHTLRGWEMRGVNKLPFERVIKLADAIGCEIRELYDEEN